MNRTEWFAPKWMWLKRFALASVAGLALVAVGLWLDVPEVAAAGLLPLVPLLFWLAYIPVLHWKERYVGTRSGVWGAFLVFETSSWSKLVYWLRHVLPDWRGTERYRDVP